MEQNLSPKEIALVLFSEEPEKPYTYQIISDDEGDDAPYIFEILVTVLMEAFEVLLGSLKNTNFSDFTVDHVLNLNPWFNSIGFEVKIKEYSQDKCPTNHYCKVVVRNNESEHIFSQKNIDETLNYHFLINPIVYNENKNKTKKLDELSLLFSACDKIFLISFDFCRNY